MYIKKKTFILIITYLSAAAIAFGAYSAVLSVGGAGYRSTARYGYEHAFGEVVTAAEKLSDALHRGAYATGAEMSASVCADVYGSCLTAGMTMSELPFSTQELENTARFVGVAADFSQSLMGSGGFDDKTRKSFAELYKTAESITEALDELRDDIDNGTVKMDEPEALFDDTGASLLSTAMLEMESGIGELPELSYDGRYNKAAAEECKDPITKDEARTIAADFLGLEGDEISLQYRSEAGATSFEHEDKSILVDGWGNVVSLSSSRIVTGDMPAEDMEKAAKEFLTKHGFDHMHLASSERMGNLQSMRFERLDGGVRCEKDSVRISVAADDGTVYSFDASGHYSDTQKHAKPKSIVTQTQAVAALPKGLSAKPKGMVYAETAGGNERLCYEFECESKNDDTMRILVDAETGSQYRISFI